MEAATEITKRFGLLFYAVNPNQTTFETPEQIPDYVNAVSHNFNIFTKKSAVTI